MFKNALRSLLLILWLLPSGLLLSPPALAQQVAVEEFKLDNGMRFLLVPRRDQPNVVSAGWVARVGSVNERPGITGISHFFEHMMFKGTDTIGTRDADRDAKYRAEQKADPKWQKHHQDARQEGEEQQQHDQLFDQRRVAQSRQAPIRLNVPIHSCSPATSMVTGK